MRSANTPICKVSKHNSTWYVYKCLSIIFTNIIINTHGYELYKYFTMVQFFEDFSEEKGFINFFVRFFLLVICYNLYLMDFSDVVPVPVCD